MDSPLTGIVTDKLVAAFCWTLIHSLWQGVIMAAIIVVILMLAKKWTSAARYNIVLSVFALFMLAAVFTFMWELTNYSSANTTATVKTMLGIQLSKMFFSNILLQQLPGMAIAFFSAHERFIVIVWLVFFSMKTIKMCTALLYNQQIKRRQIIQPGLYWTNRINQLGKTLHISKAIVLLESGYMKMPVVVGHLKPIILIPVGLLSSLPPEQVQAILLHELAHIRRNDYLVNIFQYIIETFFFFNPAVIWISSWLREERENCCDDIALAQTKNKRGLVQALISFKEHELYGQSYVTAFPGKKDHLLRRVTRIIGGADPVTALPGKLFYLITFIVLIAGAGTVVFAQKKNAAETKIPVYNVSSKITDHYTIISTPIAPRLQKQIQAKTTAILKSLDDAKRIVPAKRSITLPGMIVESQAAADRQKQLTAIVRLKSLKDREAALLNQKQAFYDQGQAVLDRQKAMSDQAKAKLDQELAMKNQARAKADQDRAMNDQLYAKLDQERAMKDQAASEPNAEQAKLNQQQALQYKKDAEREHLKIQTQSFQ
ncbi:MAG: M56 family metallopeptidase [Bacteroidota bacterium]